MKQKERAWTHSRILSKLNKHLSVDGTSVDQILTTWTNLTDLCNLLVENTLLLTFTLFIGSEIQAKSIIDAMAPLQPPVTTNTGVKTYKKKKKVIVHTEVILLKMTPLVLPYWLKSKGVFPAGSFGAVVLKPTAFSLKYLCVCEHSNRPQMRNITKWAETPKKVCALSYKVCDFSKA